MGTEKKKRILIVTDLWDTHPNGVLTVVRGLKRGLEAFGHTVDLVEPGQFKSLRFPLYPEVRIPLCARGKVKRAILEGHYDHIHIATEGVLGWHARGACRTRRIPFTTAFNGQLDLYAEKWLGRPFGRLTHWLLYRFHKSATRILVGTDALKSQLAAWGLQQAEVCPFGIDPIFFTTGTCSTVLEKPVWVYVGRISSEKSIEEFLGAPLSGTKLVIGDGPDRVRLEAQFPAAKFVGYQTGSSLIDWCACADVFIMPSRTETFGLVIVEALAQGIPVAAHDVTGPREIIRNGVNGYLDEDLARAATRCLSLSRAACRASVEKFSWETSAERFLTLAVSAQGDTSA